MADPTHETERSASDVPLPGGDFRLFVQKLGYQALIALGVLDNPVTGERTANPEGARTVLDDLAMLAEKTRGNLTDEEDAHLRQVLEQLARHREAVAGDAGGEG